MFNKANRVCAFLLILLLFNTFLDMKNLKIGFDSYISYASTAQDWRDVEFPEETKIVKPKATLRAEINGDTNNPIVAYEGNVLKYPVSTGIAIVGQKVKFFSTEGMDMYDFQYSSPNGFKKEYLTSFNGKEIILDKAGTWHFFLEVAKGSHGEWQRVWSENGSHTWEGDGYLPGKRVHWYFVELKIEVLESLPPTAEFEIHYNGQNVTDNYNNPIEVDNYPFNVNLVDKSTTPAGTTITSWEWQYYTGSTWNPLSTQQNLTDAVNGGWKGFRLRVTNNKGATSNWVRHDVYAKKKAGEQPPETPPGAWEIVPKLWADPYPARVPMKLNEYTNNLPVMIKMDLDATGSTASEGIKDYLFYYRVGKGEWIEFDWTPNKKITVDVIIKKSQENAEKKIPIDARVGVRDTQGNVRYASDDARVEIELQTAPPETELDMPTIFYPIEVTSTTSRKNIIKWGYYSEDDIPYKESVVSLYKLVGTTWTTVFENQKQVPRELEVTGNKEEIYRIVVKVVDELGKESNQVSDIFRIETAKPIIDVTLNLERVEENILGISVENLTDPEIEAIYPSSYTTWMIVDGSGNVLESGMGELPKEVPMDERYKGTVVTAIQNAVNILGNTAMDKEHYNSNALLEFSIDPNRLFETEITTITDYSRALTDRTWEIKLINEPTYQPFIYPPEGKFTKDAGKYNVQSTGKGVYVSTFKINQYSNVMADLYKEPLEPTQQEINETFGNEYVFARYTARWDGKVDVGTYTHKGTTYNYKRQRSIMLMRINNLARVRQVEFLPATPEAYFDVIGHLKAYKKVTVDGGKSVNYTNAELQAKYPIQFEDEKTMYVIEPLNGLEGNPIYIKNEYIKGNGREVINNKVVFKGKKIQDLRFDQDGVYRITYYTWNGLKLSKPFIREVVIEPELLPTVDIQVASPVVYREPNHTLRAFMHVLVLYNSPDDEIDLDKSYLTVRYDANNDGDYENDIGQQGIIRRNEADLPSHITITNRIFQADRAIFSLAIDNPDKNMFGNYQFDFNAYEKPVIPYYDLFNENFVISVNTNDIDVSKKQTLLDNTQPIINILMSRKNKSELTIIETSVTTPITASDIQYILDFFASQKIQLEIKYIDITGKEHSYKNYQ